MAILRIDPFDCQMPIPLDLRMQVQSPNALEALPSNTLWEGMEVWVVSEKKCYRRIESTWVQTYPATAPSSPPPVLTVNQNAPQPNIGVVGDMWFQSKEGGVDVYQKTAAATWSLKGTLETSSSATKTVIVSSVDITINWQTDIAPISGSGPSGKTYAQLYGNSFPRLQISMEVSPGNWSVGEQVSVTATKTNGDINTITIPTSGINTEVVIS